MDPSLPLVSFPSAVSSIAIANVPVFRHAVLISLSGRLVAATENKTSRKCGTRSVRCVTEPISVVTLAAARVHIESKS